MASQKVWSLGAHSNRRQRKSAERFVSLATSRAIQKDILLEVDSWFPINERVIIPTEQRRYYGPQQRSLERAFLIESTTQGAASEKADRISQIIQDVVYGFITPMSGAQKLLEIHD
jgi:ABC-type glycerol-3-phosphate transport system substrate-binding protein